MWVQIRRYLLTVSKYRYLILACAILSLIGAGLKTYQSPKLYRSSVTLELQIKSDSIVPELDVRSRNPYWNFDQFVNTQIKIIQSSSIARRVVEDLGLGDRMSPDAVRRMINVFPIENSHLIKITASGTDPDLMANVAMASAQAYIDMQIEKQIKRSKRVISWLDDRIEEVHGDLRDSQEQQFKFAAERSIVSLEDQRSILADRLKTVEVEHTAARTERLLAEGQYQQLARTLEEKDGYQKLIAFLQGRESPVGEVLRIELGKISAEVANKSAIYGPEHPELKKVVAQQKNLRNQLWREAQKLVEKSKVEWQLKAAKEDSLKQELARLTQETLAFNDTWINYLSLAQEVDKNQEIYEILIETFKEADVTRNILDQSAQIVEPAVPNYRHFSPNTGLNLSVALLLGLLVGVSIAFVADFYDPRIKYPSEFTKLTKLPVVVELPLAGQEIADDQAREDYVRKIALLEPASPEAELFRVLRTQVIFGGENKKALRSLIVTGVHPKEGKSTVTSNLGISIASMDKRVLLVDGDIRRASLSHSFGVAAEQGLGEVLAGEADWQSVVQLTDVPNLYIVPAGLVQENPSELFLSGALQRLMYNWQTEFDHVIVDMAPILAVSDALTLAALAEGVLLVLKPETSTKEDILETVERLNGVDAKLMGAVFNQVSETDLSGNPYYYYYRTGQMDSEL